MKKKESISLSKFCLILNDENYCQDIDCQDCPINKLMGEGVELEITFKKEKKC